MNQITYVANLPFELPLEEYEKIMNSIRTTVGEHLLRIRGSGVTFSQAGLSEDCFVMLRDSLKEHYSEEELMQL